MRLQHTRYLRTVLCAGAAVSALSLAGTALAQADPVPEAATLPIGAPDSEAGEPDDATEIIVTGTLIRGIAPAGSAVISLSEQQIEATGATSINQLLATVPQVTNFFNALPTVGANSGGGNAGFQINRPNLRNLPASASGAQTLVLIDGHRVVGAGTTMIAVDPDVVAPGTIERIEAITDGGSAIYGSDAIGGVLNFITKRRYDGLEVNARYGFADDYWSFDANVTAGTDWGTGSLYASYSFAKHDALFGFERDYLKSIDWTTGRGTSQNCTPGNVSVSNRNYPLPGLVQGTPNNCDPSIYTTVYPEETKHSVYAVFSQDLSDAVEVGLTGLYLHRLDFTNGGPFAGFATVRVPSNNPFYRNLSGVDANAIQTVRFDYAPVFGNTAARQRTVLETWQVTPTIAADIGGGWQARALFSYGESLSTFDNPEINAGVQQNFANNTNPAIALNPYDIAATSPSTLAALISHKLGIGRNKLINARLVGDGPLFSLPGGEVRAAFGIEYMKNAFSNQQTNTAYVLLPEQKYSQRVVSLFGELQVPIIGEANSSPGLHSLSLSASARYDDYSDFGDTFNPKIGLTYEPIEWLRLRGYWGTSFNAPNPAEQLQTSASQLLALPSAVVPIGTSVTPGSATILWRAGAASDLRPQTSSNWSAGFDVRPPNTGLRLSFSYYHIDFKDMLGVPDVSNNFANFFALYPDLFRLNPPVQYLAQVADQTTGGRAAINQYLQAGGPPVASIIDVRTRNLGSAKLSGLDFSARLDRPTGFGSFDLSVAGNYQLQLDIRAGPLSAYVDTLARGVSRLKLATMAGANIGNFRAQVTWNHNAGYEVTRSPLLPQDRVGAFDVVNLFLRYDVKGAGIAEDLAFTLNVDNVFDQDPPVYKLADGLSRGYANGLTLGRFIQFGVSKKF